jgi:hypothetical protein
MNKKTESLEFKCHKCGSNKLARTKRVNCITPVEIISNGNLKYDPTVIIITGDFSSNNEMFCCKDCGKILYYYNGLVKTEKRLWEYLEYCADSYFQADSTEEGSAEEHALDLMARVEEDGYVIPKPDKNI